VQRIQPRRDAVGYKEDEYFQAIFYYIIQESLRVCKSFHVDFISNTI
jgi:hypothetical protein